MPVYPPVKITKNNEVLVQDKHYTVEYKNADSVGIAQIVIKGIAPYKGEITINYEIKEKPFILGDANKDGKITASDARLVLRMSAMLEAYDDEKEVVSKILKEEMENACTLSIPLKVEVESGKNWYQAK